MAEPATLAASSPAVRPGRRGGLVGNELRTLFSRRRTLAILAVLAAVPVLIGVAVRLSSSPPQAGEGPLFLDQVSHNGLFLVFTALFVMLPFFLPLSVAVVSGDTFAGEASLGTLRYLLVAPAGRVRLLLVKYAAVVAFCVVATLVVAVSGLVTGAVLFPLGRATLLSGDTISLGAAFGRAGLVSLYVAACLAGLGAVGVFMSTLTEVPVGAMAAVAALAIASQILDNIPQVHVIHPYLFSHHWQAFIDLMRQPMALDAVRAGLLDQLGYTAVFGALAWARFTTADVLA